MSGSHFLNSRSLLVIHGTGEILIEVRPGQPLSRDRVAELTRLEPVILTNGQVVTSELSEGSALIVMSARRTFRVTPGELDQLLRVTFAPDELGTLGLPTDIALGDPD